jgi:hypothetical protein
MSNNGTIEVVNPVAYVSESGESVKGGNSVEKIEGLRVGLLSNNMPHSGDFLHYVGETFAKKYGTSISIERDKGEWTARSAGKELLDEIAGNCDVAVTGFGI